jgi:hypothetical protein
VRKVSPFAAKGSRNAAIRITTPRITPLFCQGSFAVFHKAPFLKKYIKLLKNLNIYFRWLLKLLRESVFLLKIPRKQYRGENV